MNKKVTYWIELSDYDIETAAAMLISKRYLYVSFMAHQAIEKILKAYFVKSNKETAPFSHSLSYIAKQSEIFDLFSEEQKDLIDMLEPLNIEARYPSHKKQLFESLTDERCKTILEKTKELHSWIKKKL
jgi:HEPN domain-containing protein